MNIVTFPLFLTHIIILKFIYSEKATKFCEIFTLLFSYVVPVKSKVKISQNFVAFSEYVNFILKYVLCIQFYCSLLFLVVIESSFSVLVIIMSKKKTRKWRF